MAASLKVKDVVGYRVSNSEKKRTYFADDGQSTEIVAVFAFFRRNKSR